MASRPARPTRTPMPRPVGPAADLACVRPGVGALADDAAFEVLFRAHYARLHAFVWHHTGSRTAAEELVQELFLRVWREAREGTITRITREYLYRGAHFLVLDYRKRQRLEERWHIPLEGGGPVAPAFDVAAAFADAAWDTEARALATAASAAIARMPARCRQIYLLCRQDGLSYAEIAHILGISVNTVKVQMGRAVSVLRLSLAPFLAIVPLLVSWRR